MRLPADAALLILGSGDAAEPDAVALLRVAWVAEQLPVLEAAAELAFADGGLEARLDALGATTLVICGFGAPESISAAVRSAASLGYRVFVVAEAIPEGLSLEGMTPNSARIASLLATLEASRTANFRRRWRAARGRSD